MKKIIFFITTFLLLIITSIPIMAYDEVNVNIKDVQTTEIDFVYNQRDISSEALDNIPKSIEVVKEKNVVDLNSKGYLLRHKKTGAKVFILSNDDENKVLLMDYIYIDSVNKCIAFFGSMYNIVKYCAAHATVQFLYQH